MRRVITSAFFMFLQQVFKHSKWLFFIMIFFIAAQLFVNYKWGLVVTPFYNYGMFSEVFHINDTYEVIEVEQNGKILRGQDFSNQKWDKIMLPIQYYAGINRNNELYNTDIKRELGELHISLNDKNFLLQCNYQEFENWYKNYLQQITGQPIQSLNIYFRKYRYTSHKLTATDSVSALSQQCH